VDRTEPAVQRPALVLGVLSASILLDALDLSITQVALPSIQRELALLNESLQALAYAAIGGQGPQVRRRRTE